MTEKLEYAVRIDLESNERGINWTISEFDVSENKIVKDGLQPWPCTLYFDVVDLRLTTGVEQPLKSGPEDIINAVEVISAALIPQKDGGRTTSYSMLGKSNPITDITIRITKAKAGMTPQCRLWGGLAYESEWDFRTVRIPDALQFYLELSEAHFDELKLSLRTGNIESSIFSIKAVSGFYSYSSPSIKTEYIKVLVGTEEQNVSQPEASNIRPFVVGEIGEFYFRFTTKAILTMSKDDDCDRTDYSPEKITTSPSDINSKTIETLYQLENTSKRHNNRLEKILWIICGLMLLNLFF